MRQWIIFIFGLACIASVWTFGFCLLMLIRALIIRALSIAPPATETT